MEKITDIEVLKTFETHYAVAEGEHILVWNVLTKETYQSLKRKVRDSERKIARLAEKNSEKTRIPHPLQSALDEMIKSKTELQMKGKKDKEFYIKRITERNSWNASLLLEADLLPETLLRDMYLNNAETFTLLRAGENYVGILSRKENRGFLSMLNGGDLSNAFGNTLGGNEKIGGMSILPFIGGGNKW